MKLDDILLTNEEEASACDNCKLDSSDGCANCDKRYMSQCLKILEVLEKEGKIKHHCTFKTSPDRIHDAQECIEHCWLCKLKKDLGWHGWT